MKFIIFSGIFTLCLISVVWAGDGHNHGNSAFEGNQYGMKEFSLTETQIHNLRLQTTSVEPFEFYETITIPMVVDAMHDKNSLAHGFVYEGAEIMKIKKGQDASFVLDVMPEEIFYGKIIRVEEMIDPQSRLYSVYASTNRDFPSNTHGLKGEMSIKVTPKKKALGIPVSALQGEFGDYFVFVKHNEHFERKDVIIGQKTDGMVEVVGLNRGDVVVTRGSYQLRYASGKALDDHGETQEEKEHKHTNDEKHPE